MRIDVFSIFPEVVAGYCRASILGRAMQAGTLDVRVHDLRQGAHDTRRSVDDSPFGGGAGMVLMPEPLFRSVEAVPDLPRTLYLLAPGGRTFDQAVAAVESNPASDLLVLDSGGLIPVRFVTGHDPSGHTVDVDIPDGLLEV